MIKLFDLKIKRSVFYLMLSMIFISCTPTPKPIEVLPVEFEAQTHIYKMVEMVDNEYQITDTVIGTAYFSQTKEIVILSLELKNQYPNAVRAVHIHNGTLTQPGRHWNWDPNVPESFYSFCTTFSLGQVWGKPYVGDVGNVNIDENGYGTFSIQTDLWSLMAGDKKNILGKIIIVHQHPENFEQECDPQHSHNLPHTNPKIGGGQIEEIVMNIE